MGRSGAISENDASALRSLESGRTENISGITAVYARILDLAVRMPVAVFVLSILMLITIVTAYGRYGKGVEFFTGVEPSQTQIQVFARGNFSPAEVRDLMLDVRAVFAAWDTSKG